MRLHFVNIQVMFLISFIWLMNAGCAEHRSLNVASPTEPKVEMHSAKIKPERIEVYCGTQRRNIKDFIDDERNKVDLNNVKHVDISDITTGEIPVVKDYKLPTSRRVTSDNIHAEFSVYEVTGAWLRFVKYESGADGDHDYHLVITKDKDTPYDNGPSNKDNLNVMIAEVPDWNDCLDTDNMLYDGIKSARVVIDKLHPTQKGICSSNTNIDIRGIGFYDHEHGQTGFANNGIELHPVFYIHINNGGTFETCPE